MKYLCHGPGQHDQRSHFETLQEQVLMGHKLDHTPKLSHCLSVVFELDLAQVCPEFPILGEAIHKFDRVNQLLPVQLLSLIVFEIDRIFINISQNSMCRFGHTHFRITHRRGRIPVNRAEIALPIKQRQTHREILRHTHQSVIN